MYGVGLPRTVKTAISLVFISLIVTTCIALKNSDAVKYRRPNVSKEYFYISILLHTKETIVAFKK